MPIYVFKCLKGHTEEKYIKLADFTNQSTCTCGAASSLVVLPPNINVFKPYVEYNMNKDPIVIETAKQRDALCAKLGVTYDTGQFVRKPNTPAAVDSLDYGVVKRAIENGRLEDGTPIEQPVVDTET